MSSSSGSATGTHEHFRESPTTVPRHMTDHRPLSAHPSLYTHTNGPSKASTPNTNGNQTSPLSVCCTPPYKMGRKDSSTYPDQCYSDLTQSTEHDFPLNTSVSCPVFAPFVVKSEATVQNSPVRNLSGHSFPSNTAPSFNPVTPHSDRSDGFSVEGFSSSNLVSQAAFATTTGSSAPRPSPSYPTHSCFDPNRSVLLHSPLVNPFRPDNFHLSVFGNQSVTASPLSLISQGQVSAQHVSINALANSNPGTLAHPHAGPFDFNDVQLTAVSNFSTDDLLKRTNSNGNGLCGNLGPLMDLSTAATSGLSKSRRFSYPYEHGIATNEVLPKQQFTIDYPSSSGDRSDQEDPSPTCFRALTATNLPLVNLSTLTSNGTRIPASRTTDDSHGIHKLSTAIGAEVPLPGFSSPESAFYQYQNRMEGQRCQVCGELAAGFHHGAYVCEACKKFFMRHSLTDTKPTNVCPTGGNCVVAKGSRGKCQICRYRKCLFVGMKMKDPESQPDVDISHIPCRVCGGRSSGFHFGALTCEGCKGFFRRTEGSAASLVCVGGQNACTITPRSRNACKSCRFRRCLAAGMSKKGSRIGRQPNAVKFHCAIEIRQLRSLRSNYPGLLDNQGTSNNMYTGLGGPDSGCLMLDTPGSASVHNRSDADSPDNLTPTYNSTKREGGGDHNNSSVWINEQKPPLSLLLLLPHTSDPIDVSANCGGQYGLSADASQLHLQHYSPGYHSRSLEGYRTRCSDSDVTVVDSSVSMASRVPLDSGSDHMVENAPRSMSDEGDDDDTAISNKKHPPPMHPLSCRTNLNDTGGTLGYHPASGSSNTTETAQQALSTSPYASSALDDQNGLKPDEEMAQNGQITATLIADLAQRLSEQEEASGALNDADDWLSSTPPSEEAIVRFTEGMRTATEFLRLPNTYFKTRFRMSSIPINIRDNVVQVWNHMMNHFHMHAQQIVQFAKLVPGFNQLGITARSSLVRGAMYPVVLLLLSRDYIADTDEYNYFDFTLDERAVIMHHFPTFSRITEHLRMTGRLLHHLNLSLPELSLSSAVEILRNYQSLEEPTRSNTRELFILANHSLRACMTRRSDMTLDDRHRWAQLVALSKMIQAMNQEHHEILAALKDSRFDLHFPELYVEMFQLADSASALFSASAQAATLACSTAFQSLAPLKFSFSGSPDANAVTSQATSGDSQSGGFMPTGDRWDASRLALAVPAAMAAMAAVATGQPPLSHPQHPAETMDFEPTTTVTTSLEQQQQQQSQTPSLSFATHQQSS